MKRDMTGMRVLLPVLLLAAAAAPGAAQRRGSDAPIDFAADAIELQDRANRAVLSGAVRVTQGELALTSDRLTVDYTGQVLDGNPQVSRLVAAGDVQVRRPDQTARANYAIYDLNSRLITMVGAVTLNQGANTVSGGRLTINLDTNRAVIDGSSVGGGAAVAPGAQRQGGRVTGTFSVPKRQ